MEFQDLYHVKTIGCGGYANVYLGLVATGKTFKPIAVKELLEEHRRNPDLRYSFFNEARVLATMVHRNIVGFKGIRVIGDTPYLIMDYVPASNLGILLGRSNSQKKPLSITTVWYLAQQILQGLEYMHKDHGKPSVVHGDCSLANILVDSAAQVKIVDFGSAHYEAYPNPHQNYSMGQLKYLAPEQFTSNGYGVKADVYSLGVMLWEMLSNQPFDFGVDDQTLFDFKALGYFPPVERESGPGVLETELLIGSCLKSNPEERISSSEALATVTSLINKYDIGLVKEQAIAEIDALVGGRLRKDEFVLKLMVDDLNQKRIAAAKNSLELDYTSAA